MPEIGAYVIGNPEIPAEDRLRIFRDAGFDFVCFGMNGLKEGITPEACDRAGIPFDNIHLSGAKTNFIWGTDPLADKVCDRYCREIREVSELGIHKGIVHVTWGQSTTPDAPGEIGFARYERIRQTAAECGFTVCVENSIFPEHFYSVLDRFTGPEFAHCFDCGHHNAFLKDHDILGKYGNRLAATHIHDNDGINDLHILPFDGTVDWEALAARFAKNSFASRMICSESGGPKTKEIAGKTAEEISVMLEPMRIDKSLVRIEDGKASFYENIPYDEFVSVLYGRMKRFSDMIEKAGSRTNCR